MALGDGLTETAMTFVKTLATATPIGLIAAALISYIRARPEMARIKKEGDAAFAARMMARVEDLERRLGKAEAELQVTRHQLNNANQSTDMLIMLVESYLKRAGDHEGELTDIIERVKAYRAAQAQNIAVEKGAMASAIRRVNDDD